MKTNWKIFIKKRYKLPPKPFKDLEDYRQHGFTWFSHAQTKSGKWPCIHCAGRGGGRRAEDCDPVEGYKMAPFYKCNACCGSGEGYRSEVELSYRRVLRLWRRNRKKMQEKVDAALKVARRLSSKDMEILHNVFGQVF